VLPYIDGQPTVSGRLRHLRPAGARWQDSGDGLLRHLRPAHAWHNSGNALYRCSRPVRYAIGRLSPQFQSLDVDKEFAQLASDEDVYAKEPDIQPW